MNEKWGRAGAAGTWPGTKAISILAVLMLAIVSGMGIGAYQYGAIWAPLQRFYLSTYLRTEFLDDLTFKTGRYRLLNVIDSTDQPQAGRRRRRAAAANDQRVDVHSAGSAERWAIASWCERTTRTRMRGCMPSCRCGSIAIRPSLISRDLSRAFRWAMFLG